MESITGPGATPPGARWALLFALLAAPACITVNLVPMDDDTAPGGDDGTADDDASADDDTTTGECRTDNETCGPPGTCGADENSRMLPGADCMACHAPDADSTAAQEQPFTAAGTVFSNWLGNGPAAYATVVIRDDSGKQVTLTSNSVGNFHTDEPLNFPITATVSLGGGIEEMVDGVDDGGCNSCHSCAGEADGKLFAP